MALACDWALYATLTIWQTSRMRTLIIGCGYVGVPVGARLAAAGHDVYGLRRTAESEEELVAAGIEPLTGDITKPEDLARLPGPFDWVVNLVSSSRGGADVYRDVYLGGTSKVLDWLRNSPPTKYIYTSSTSVYGQTDGSWITEDDEAQPSSETARILVETEKLLLKAAREGGFPATILRVAGIYGPGRGHLFLKYLRDEATLSGDGSRLINMIHLDDLVTAIVAGLERGQPGKVYNVVDDEPVEQIRFYRWLAETLGKPMPPRDTEREAPKRKRALTNKKVSNCLLKEEIECAFKYPSFREGYGSEIERLRRDGRLRSGD